MKMNEKVTDNEKAAAKAFRVALKHMARDVSTSYKEIVNKDNNSTSHGATLSIEDLKKIPREQAAFLLGKINMFLYFYNDVSNFITSLGSSLSPKIIESTEHLRVFFEHGCLKILEDDNND